MHHFGLIGRPAGADVTSNNSIIVIGLRVTHIRSLIYWKILSTGNGNAPLIFCQQVVSGAGAAYRECGHHAFLKGNSTIIAEASPSFVRTFNSVPIWFASLRTYPSAIFWLRAGEAAALVM